MTKQIDALLGDAKSVEKKSSTPTSEKKEGASLFDSILATAKSKSQNDTSSVEQKSSKKQTSSEANTTKESSSVKPEQKESKQSIEQKGQEKTELSTDEKKVVKDSKTENIKAEVSDSTQSNKPVEKKEVSLLDRMVVEAKSTIKNSKEDVKAQLNTVNNKSENKSDDKQATTVQKQSTENTSKNLETSVIDEKSKKLDNSTAQVSKEVLKEEKQPKDKVTSLLQGELKEKKSSSQEALNSKTTIKVDPALDKSKPNKATDTKTTQTTQEVKAESAKTEGSLLDRLLGEAKNSIKTTKDTQDNTLEEKSVKDTKQQVKPTSVESKVTDELVKVSTLNQDNSVEVKTEAKESSVTTAKASEVATVIQANKELKDKGELQSLQKAQNSEHRSVQADLAQGQEKSQSSNSQRAETPAGKVEKNIESTLKESANKTETPVKNEKVAQELAKLNSATVDEKVTVSKEQLESVSSEPKKEKLSLLDKLVNESKAMLSNQEEKASIKSQVQESKLPKNEILTNIYLSSQNKKVEDKSIETHAKGKEQALNAKNVDDIKNSAKTLDIGLKEAEVEVATPKSEKTAVINDKNLERLAFAKNVAQDDLQQVDLKSKTISKEASKALSEPVVNLQVSAQNANNIAQKIIGARQQMASMMSDIAKEMYSNYKPPVTAFRLNLQPAHLGSIAIMIKSDREGSISISMNMSQSATLEAVTENQSSLRSALNKSFGEQNSFDLDFGMQDDKNEQQDAQKDKNQQQNRRAQTSTESLLEAREQNSEESLINYM